MRYPKLPLKATPWCLTSEHLSSWYWTHCRATEVFFFSLLQNELLLQWFSSLRLIYAARSLRFWMSWSGEHGYSLSGFSAVFTYRRFMAFGDEHPLTHVYLLIHAQKKKTWFSFRPNQRTAGLLLVLFHSVMYTTSNRPSLTKWPHTAQVNTPTSWWHNVIICLGFCSLFLRHQVRRLLQKPDEFKGITTHAESPEGNDWTMN